MYFDEDVNDNQFQLNYFSYDNDDGQVRLHGYHHLHDYASHLAHWYGTDPECFDPMVRAMLTVDGEPSDIDEARTFDDWED
eukprot:3443441-Rhodomonas_salina.1